VTFTDIGVSQAFNRDQKVPQIRLTHRDGKKIESTIVAGLVKHPAKPA
jgi:hypothetical protein